MKDFDKDIIEVVWEKGRVIEGYDPAKFRQDACGAWITRDKYGDKSSNFGWVIDHICPRSLLERHHVPEEVINDMVNLQPMHWANDVAKAESYPIFLSGRYGVDGDNIALVQSFIVNDNVRQALGKLFDPFFVQC